eukprot:TRINITY_DN27138_c0_g1_i1.p1 TRINITY_DN27138_c0_g1~~TRINITY_DN27138_c0_g1_i1.p1  ORF type:complete len:454 (-),score=29.17 TRINITY_DN27138_c0_g1_i1:1073-2434(-)
MSIDHQGYLSKEGAGLIKRWSKRWFVLRGHELFYYKDQKDSDSLGSIDLRHTSVTPTTAKDNSFSVSGSNLPRTYHLAADTPEDRQTWHTKLLDAIAASAGRQSTGSAGLSADGAEEHLFTATQGQRMGLKDFDILKVIGRGSFGKVMKVKRKDNGDIFAMKVLRKDVVIKENMVQNMQAEKTILQNLQHPFIVKLHFAFQTRERLYLVLDLLPGGELFFHLKNEGRFSEERTRFYAAEIASALSHLHAQEVVYRDLKPENCVLDKDGHVCLTDFGLAKTSIPGTQKTYTFCGTPEFLAPEIIKGTGHGKQVDWWAFGVLVYEMLTGKPPFYSDNVNDMYDFILNGAIDFPQHVSKDGRDLLLKLLDKDQTKRLCSKGVKSHPFFNGVDWDKLLKRAYKPAFVPDLTGDPDKYVESVFKEEPTKNSICFRAPEPSDSSFTGFTYAQQSGVLLQ